MRNDDWMLRVCQFFSHIRVPNPIGAIVMRAGIGRVVVAVRSFTENMLARMQSAQTIHLFLERIWEGLISFVHRGKHRIAAALRKLSCHQDRTECWLMVV